MNPTPERTEKRDGGTQARPFPFPLTLVERERDGSCYFVSSPDGKLDARHKRLVAFEVGCATDHAKHIEICVNSHADLVAQNEALRGALELSTAELQCAHERINWQEMHQPEGSRVVALAPSLKTRIDINLAILSTPPAKA